VGDLEGDLEEDLEGDLGLVGDLEKEGRGERGGGSGRSSAVEGGLAVEEAEESGFSGFSFARSLSLSFLKMWASWTMSGFGALAVFFFFSGRGSKDDEGGRNAEIGMGSTTVRIWKIESRELYVECKSREQDWRKENIKKWKE
jgi:hypothetical protein